MIRDLCPGQLNQICDEQHAVGSSPIGNSLSSGAPHLASSLILTGGSAYWRLLKASFPTFPQSAYGGVLLNSAWLSLVRHGSLASYPCQLLFSRSRFQRPQREVRGS